MHMSKTLTRSLSQRNVVSTKLIMGVMVAAVSVLVGTSNIAGATPGKHHGQHNNGNGNHGVGANAHANAGFGYGGNVNVDIGGIIGNNNVIVVIVNYFVGH